MSRLEGFYSLSDGWKSFRDGAVSGELALATVLLVTSDGGLSAGNTALRDILVDAGYPVTVRALSEPEDYTGIGVVVHSYGNPEEDNGKYVQPPVGMVGIDTWRPLGMGTLLGYQNTVTQVEVVDSSSPLAGGVTGVFDAYLAGAYITWETDLASNPDVIVTRPAQTGQAVVFAYEAGSAMPGRFATTRHVALGYHQDGLAQGLTAAARSQVLAAVSWARNSTFVAPPPPDVPTGLSAYSGDGRLTLSWGKSVGATSYNVKRAEVTGGPYTTIQTGVTSTSYLDSGLVNGTPYYYVVSAENAAGESANSSETSATPTSTQYSFNLALLATSAELAMWQDRKVNGPFKSFEDFSTNSPGHWDEMNAAMSTDWTAGRWSGPPIIDANGVVLRDGRNAPQQEHYQNAHDMMSAAYAALVENDTTVASTILSELEWHADQTWLDFADRTKYPYGYDGDSTYYDDVGITVWASFWANDMLQAYDVVRSMGYSSSTVENWFLGLAEITQWNLDENLRARFPDRDSDDYSLRSDFVDTDVQASTRYADASLSYHLGISRYYNNRRGAQAGFCGMAGLLTNTQTYIDSLKRYSREWLMFGNRTTPQQETGGDHNRGSDSFPQLSLTYDYWGMSQLFPAWEALARSGDTSIYDFSSSEGSAHPTWGSNHLKTFEEVLDQKLRWIAGTTTAHYTGSGAPPGSYVAGDQFYRIKSRSELSGREMSTDGHFLMAAAYYGRTDWVDIIMRDGTPTGFTSSPHNMGPIFGWRNDWRQRFLRSLDANPHGGA